MESGTIDVGIMPPATYVQARNIEGAISILSSNSLILEIFER